MCVAAAADEMSADGIVVYATGYGGGDSGYSPVTGYDEQPLFFITGGSAFVTKLVFPRLLTAAAAATASSVGPPKIVYDRPLPAAVLGNKLVAMQGMRVVVDEAQLVIMAASHAVSDWPFQFGFIGAERADGSVRWAQLHPPSDAHPATQSHPFAFAVAPGGGYVAAGHVIEVRQSSSGGAGRRLAPDEMPTGRALKIDERGRVVWDARFLATDDADLNTECYGVSGLADGTIAVTCGAGVEPEDHPTDSPKQKTWRVFNALLSTDGAVLWATNLTSRDKLQNNAGEYVVGTADGGAAVYVDAQSWGSPSTGGNFALMKLAPAQLRQAAAPQPTVELFAGTAAIPAPAVLALEWPPPAPYDHIVKELGEAAAASVDACQAACVAYRNPSVSPVSGWTRCTSFTHLDAADGQPARCVAVVDAEEWAPLRTSGAVAGRLTWPPQPCTTHADCSFNGECNATTSLCECDAAWTGDRCQTLALEPTSADAGLRLVDAAGANVSSWGGAVLLDAEASPPLYHMWASEISEGCGIDAWRSNSRIVHATSTDGRHFSREGVVFEAFAHEPTVARAPSGEYVMWFTGEAEGAPSPPRCLECAGGNTPADTNCTVGAGATGPTYLAWASTPDGPWTTPRRLFAAQEEQTNMDTNLAAAILPNGSVVGIARTGGGPTGISAHLVTASDWRDPASYVGRWKEMLFPNTTIVPDAGVEDPFVWCDAATGVFHAVFHSQIEADDERLCGGHAFSEDGEVWTFTGTAWSNLVPLSDAKGALFQYRFSRRERPHIMFDARGRIVVLTTGVQFGQHSPTAIAGEDACYTMLQPVSQ